MRYRRNRAWCRSAFAVIALFAVFVLVPLYWVVITSIKPSDDYLATPPVWFPAHPTLRALHRGAVRLSRADRAAEQPDRGLGHDRAVGAARHLHGLQPGAFQHRGRHLAFWVLSQRFLPPVAIVLPIFLLYRNYGLYDTRAGLVLVYTVFTLPLSSWMMYAYFRQVPRELEDAALVDGASRWQAFWRIAVPLAVPGIAAAAVFAFIAVWTEFFFALILTSRYAFTLPTVFRSFIGFQGAQYGESSALAVTSLVPSIVLGMLVQRHLVRGLTMGAVQG